MQPYHQTPKEFEKRVEIESKKVKAIAGAMEKTKKALESEKKAYSVDLKKGIDVYA